MKYKLTLRWWLFLCVQAVASYFAWQLGFFKKTWEIDSSFICVGISVSYILCTIYTGLATLSWENSKDKMIKSKPWSLEPMWFSAEQFMTFGFLGTLIGFAEALMYLSGVDVSNTVSVQKLLSNLGVALGIAIYTSIYGALTAFMLKTQLFNLEHGKENEV